MPLQENPTLFLFHRISPERAEDLGGGAHVDVIGVRSIASQIALGGADRRAQSEPG